MPEYLAPGVYVEEVDTGSKPIEGVSTSTSGMVGAAERGPVNVPILVTSVGEYNRWFGERLNIEDFSNGPADRHCYLPHAIQGFFDNGGKRVYVTRVLDTIGAVRASAYMFDRGKSTSADTVLLRSAAELTGTLANLPRLIVLDASAIALQDWIRIGDGSHAEYRQANAAPAADTTLLTLNFPLKRTHAAGKSVDNIVRTTAGGALTFSGGVSAGSGTIVVKGAVADIDNLVAAIDNATPAGLIEIAGDNSVEYRFAVAHNTAALLSSGKQVTLTLDSALTMAYDDGSTVQRLTLPAATVSSSLDTASAAGDRLVFLTSNAGFTGLVIVESGDNAKREVRLAGVLNEFDLAVGAYEDYPAGSLVEKIAVETDTRLLTVAATAATSKTLTLNSVAGLAVGQKMLLDVPGPLRETVTISAIDTNTRLVTLTAAVANNHAVSSGATPAPKALTASAAAGANLIALDNRLGLDVGDVIRISDASNVEYLSVTSVPGRASTPVAPDAGNVVFNPALANAYAVAGTSVEREMTLQLVSAAAAGAVSVTLNSTTGVAALKNLVLNPGGSNAETVAVSAVNAATKVATVSALVNAHEAGETVLVQTACAELVLDLAAEGDKALVTNKTGFAAGNALRVTSPAGGIFYHVLKAIGTTPTPDTVELDAALVFNHPGGSPVVERSPLFDVEALDHGAWGNRLRISLEDESPGLVPPVDLTQFGPLTRIRLSSFAGVEPGTVLEFSVPDTDEVKGPRLKVAAINRANGDITLAGAGLDADQQAAIAALPAGKFLKVRSREFSLTVRLLRQPDPAMPSRNETVLDSEGFRNLSMDPRHSRYIHKVIGDTDGALRISDRRPEGDSACIRVHDLAQDLADPAKTTALESVRVGPETLIDILPGGSERPARHALYHGYDSVPTLTDDDYIGADSTVPENRTGLQSLRNVEEISIVAIPGRTSMKIQNALIGHCEQARYRFGVLDGPQPPKDTLADVQNLRQQFDTKYAAIYYPWLIVPDPYPANLAQVANYPVPPSGHMLGIYARTDIERGVHKAPANEVVRGITGLQRLVNKEQQDILNPYPVNINVIRDFRPNNRGIRVYGGRVITSDSDWKYVNVRRLLIFIEASIDRGLQWVVFEPNAEPLWARVRRSVSNFLTLVWRNGALEGTKPEEAYFVKCDRTTMTQTDIDSGRLICLIGVAPVKPAEYVIIRIGLWTAHAED
jgi:uncharacterized protein